MAQEAAQATAASAPVTMLRVGGALSITTGRCAYDRAAGSVTG